MYQGDDKENPFTLDPSLKSLLTFKEQEKNIVTKEEFYEKPHDRLYYTGKGASHYGLIKTLQTQAFGLSEFRNEIVSNEKKNFHSALNPTNESKPSTAGSKRTELPNISNERRKSSIGQHVKERKETLREFLGKGKQIFLEKMMMDMKREETVRLTEFIINEEETLNEHEADFREHVKFSNTFIQDLNKDAERTINESKEKNKEIDKEDKKIAQLEQQIKALESQIKKKKEDKEIYETYKKFVIELYEPVAKSFNQEPEAPKLEKDQQNVFLTTQKEGEGLINNDKQNSTKLTELKLDNPKQIVELLKRNDDATIFLIHNTQEREKELEKTRKAIELEKNQIIKKFNERKESLLQVQKLQDKLEKEKNRAYEKLNRLEKAPQNSLAENGGLDKVKIRNKIQSMCMELTDGKVMGDQKEIKSDQVLEMMAALETELESANQFFMEAIDEKQNLTTINLVEKEITKEKRQNQPLLKQIIEDEKKKIAFEKRKNKKVIIREGRRAMKKMLLKTEKETEKVIDEDLNRNDDEKYFKESFTFMEGLTVKEKSNTAEEKQTIGSQKNIS